MKNKIYLLLLGTMLAAQFAQAQKCRTPTTPPIPYLLRDETRERSAVSTDEPYVVRIFVHILRDFDGTNVAMTDSALNANLQQMANYFQPHGICFMLVGQDFIDHTGWNRYYDIDDADMVDGLTAVNPHPYAIDIYFHRTILPGILGGLVGYAYNIPSGKLSVEAYTRGTLEHEMGHCLGLYHTFETYFGLECPSGYNCKVAGDKVCDTPADYEGAPFTNCLYSGNVATTCQWLPPHDPFLHPYNPLGNNIMSYNDSCYSAFTPEQGGNMRDNLNDFNFLENCLAPENWNVTGLTLSGEVSYGARSTIRMGDINGFGDLYLTGSAHGVFNAGSLVQLLPGTYIAPGGSNSVVLKINDLCDGVNKSADGQGNDRSEASKIVAEKPATIWNVAPNPFSGSTSVTYTLTEPSRVSIFVFRATGDLVATLAPGEIQEAGDYSYEFDAKDLPAGVYFLDIQQDGKRTTKRLVLTR